MEKINIQGRIAFGEPMSEHTTFKTGGPADMFCSPETTEDLIALIRLAEENSMPVFILGGGANILVSDAGIRGMVIETANLNRIDFSAEGLGVFGSGLAVDAAAEASLDAGLAGLDAFYGMPGTIGGAVWMNARCYGVSIADILVSVKYLDKDRNIKELVRADMNFDYKVSPFQSVRSIILEASFKLQSGNKAEIKTHMLANRADRQAKGHYAGPSAGSVFKNNRNFGRPSGVIIDSLGLRGFSVGGAKVSDNHANIFINTGSAKSSDIYRLIMECRARVKQAYGFELEPEVQFIGDFN